MSSNPPSAETPPWIEASRAFLHLLEAEGEGAVADLKAALTALVAAAEGTRLPEIDEDQEHDPLVHEETWWMAHVQRRFPKLGLYAAPDGLYGDAAGDLAELALELEQSLSIADAGKPVLAQWEWRFGYDTHWGWAHAQPLLMHLATG
ncbi:MAG: hypothetical protein Q8L66_08170 [Caulobacter sp.]|nr:hypothetical protein [Caulobacter sp.]